MKYRIVDRKYRFVSAFDTETGAYVRTGVLDDKGKDTGVDPFMASFPHLIDVGVMGHCIHASLNRSKKGGHRPPFPIPHILGYLPRLLLPPCAAHTIMLQFALVRAL